MAALMPVISAGRNQNSQTILIGTPPSPTCVAEVFKSAREQALSGNGGRICWHEWSVDEIGNVRDWSRVADTNPSLDVRLMRSNIEAEMAAMSPDYFARERLGLWQSQVTTAAIGEAEWRACASHERASDGLYSYGVKFSYDGYSCAVTTCLRPSEGVCCIGLAQVFYMSDGLSAIADFLMSLKDKASVFTIDGASYAQPLIDELIRRGMPRRLLRKPKLADVATACASLHNAIRERDVRHLDQQMLNESALKSKKRSICNGNGWAFCDNDCDSAPIESCALAYWSALNTKRNPTRKQRMAF